MRLPILDLLRQAVLTVLYRPKQWLMAFSPFLAISFALRVPTEPSLLWLGLGILALPASIVSVCAWHRNLITGTPAWPRLGKPEWLFFKTALIMGLIAMLPMVPATLLVSTFGYQGLPAGLAIILLASILATWMVTPTMLALPANAVGQSPSSNHIERLVAGNHGRVFALILVVPLMETILSQLLAWGGSWTNPIAIAVELLFWPLGVSVLTLAYIWLNDHQTETPPE